MGDEADAGARRQLGRQAEVRAGHDADHRVAAGDRMVGEEQDGLTRGRHLQRAAHGALGLQLALPHALERRAVVGGREAHADPVGLLAHVPVLREQALQARLAEPVVAGAGDHAQHGHLAGRGHGAQRGLRVPHRRDAGLRRGGGAGGGRARGGGAGGAPRIRADAAGEAVPRRQRGGAEPGQGVGRAAAEHGRHVDPAPEAHVHAQAADRLVHRQRLAVQHDERRAGEHPARGAVGRGDRPAGLGAGQGHHLVAVRGEGEAAQDGLQHRLA